MKQEPLVVVAAFAIAMLSACGASARPPAARRSDLPPHAVALEHGLWTCERGYLLRNRACVSEAEAAQDSKVEIYDASPPPLVDLEAPQSREERLKAMPGFEWDEADFLPRPVVAHPFSLDPADPSTVIGAPTSYVVPPKQTLYEAARHLGLGINQVALAFPDLDLLAPPTGRELDFPTWWVLPEADPQGLVVNVPEMRIYYFPPSSPGRVITYPVGLGRIDWRTPIERFKVVDKAVDPPWIIPASIQEEHIRERGDARTMIPGGDPDNPLGRYRLRLDLPLYGIHGTNIPWGIGMQVTHGCVRLYPEDIETLFEMVPLGTPGEFVYQPVKLGARGGEVYVEVHPDVYRTGFNYVSEAMRLLGAKGWSKAIDWDLLNTALVEQRAEPTRISDGSAPLRGGRARRIEARGGTATSLPPS
jgi:L,D-transpeptidase ErfK/SrfK